MGIKQVQSLKQQLKLTPQQIQLLKLIQMPITALEQKIQEELENNPALETLDSANEIDENEDINSNDTIDTEEENNNEENEVDNEEYELSKNNEVDIEEYMDDEEMDSYKYDANNYSSEKENDFFTNNIAVSSQYRIQFIRPFA